jgi:hypothetical protein
MSRHANKLSIEFVKSKITINQETNCWDWIGSLQTSGYGQVKEAGKNWTAHRASWVAHHGAIADGKQVLHHCDNPRCCNPEHMYLGSVQDNVNDKMRRGRHVKRGKDKNRRTYRGA